MADGAIGYAEMAATIFSGGAGLGAGAFFAKWFFEWIGGRVDMREARIDKATHELLDRMEGQIKGLTARVDTLEAELEQCQSKHRESMQEVARLTGLITGLGDARQHAALIVAAEKVDGKEK